MASPFHEGELRVQERAGVRELAARIARGIRPEMPDQHRELFEKLPYLVVGGVHEGRPWASFLVGMPGFVHAPDPRTLVVGAVPVAGDPVAPALVAGAPVGVLGIELETRRRNRANGTVRSRDARGFTVAVNESFGNCPQYIQAREPLDAIERGPLRSSPERGSLSPRARSLVETADTLFLASADLATNRVDVSHRGGKPGFVRVDARADRAVLTMPDFSGNNFFMTLGNLERNPRAGLAIVDFASGALLSLTGTTETIWEGPELEGFAGAQRLVKITVEDGVLLENAIPFVWSDPEQARQLGRTGEWPLSSESSR